LIRRKLGAVSQAEHREGGDEGLRLLDRAEVPCHRVGQARPGAARGEVAAADLVIQPAMHVEEQVLEAALRHAHVDAHRVGAVVQLLLRRAAPFHTTSLGFSCS
jgi:hypothetical protein